MISRLWNRLKSVAMMLWVASIWHPGAIPVEEFKYRHSKRVWLPLFDVISMVVGFLAIVYGSRILQELYPAWLIDTVGAVFLGASMLALLGVAFPRLWMVEILGKILMLALLGSYSAAIWVSFLQGSVQSGFVAATLMLPLITPLSRLQVLGEEIKQRRVES